MSDPAEEKIFKALSTHGKRQHGLQQNINNMGFGVRALIDQVHVLGIWTHLSLKLHLYLLFQLLLQLITQSLQHLKLNSIRDHLRLANLFHSTEDAFSSVLHLTLQHLEEKNTNVQILFVFSLSFNPIIPEQLVSKLAPLGVNTTSTTGSST